MVMVLMRGKVDCGASTQPPCEAEPATVTTVPEGKCTCRITEAYVAPVHMASAMNRKLLDSDSAMDVGLHRRATPRTPSSGVQSRVEFESNTPVTIAARFVTTLSASSSASPLALTPAYSGVAGHAPVAHSR